MKKDKMINYKIIKAIFNPIFRILYWPKIIGKDNIPKDGPIIIAGNHRHAFDQNLTIISTKRPLHYMAKKEYFTGEHSFFGNPTKIGCAISKWVVKSAGCISVDRNIKDEEASHNAIEVLNDGKALGLFPEGTRNKTAELLLPFKFGAVSLAKKTNATIVPYAISGDYKIFRKNLKIEFGKPFKIGDMSLEEANEKLRSIVIELLNK